MLRNLSSIEMPTLEHFNKDSIEVAKVVCDVLTVVNHNGFVTSF
jgi:hypothetical protein